MGKRRNAVGKSGKEPAAPRARNLDHLKNKKLHGLEFGLTQRNNILIDCWAADRVSQEVIMDCFEKAGIYPPGASAALVPEQSRTRNSRRIEKVEAGKELQRIANDMTLTTDQRITQCSEVLEDIMEISRYEQLSPEKLCPLKRKKCKRSSTDHGSISPSPSPSPSRPAHKNVLGNFSPAALRRISDSFAQEREEFNHARQFICTVAGCSFGLRGAPSRFSSEGYLRSHMKQKHGVVLTPMNADDVKALKKRQKAVDDSPTAVSSPVAANHDQEVDLSFGFVDIERFSGTMWECMKCSYQTDDADGDMANHFWNEHPDCIFGGKAMRNLQTGEEICDEPPENPAPPEYVEILQRWLGKDVSLFKDDKTKACWDAICEDARANEWTPDYDRVAAALQASGYIRPGKYVDNNKECVKRKVGRKCSNCKQTGHDKRTCPNNDQLELSPVASPFYSPNGTPVHSPTASPQASHAQSPTTQPRVCNPSPEPSKRRSCSMQ
jgi:hypothetical protein